MSIRFHSGNYLENLACKLSEDIKQNSISPFEYPIVITQSQGMTKWISLELAKNNGICANINFRFPKEFIYDCFHKITGSLPPKNLYEKDSITWKIMGLLPRLIDSEEFSTLKAYLKRLESQLKYYQLSEKIASLYDQYLIFRPEWIFDWQNGRYSHIHGDENKWQAILWKNLVDELGAGHPAQIRELFKKAFESRKDINTILPKNVYVFGISTLPKFYIDILNLISNKIHLYMYHLNPSKEYWGDISKKHDSNLLASMGTLGRDFFTTLLESEIDQNEDGNIFVKEIEDHNILARFQKDIFELVDHESNYKKYIVEKGDMSLAIHSCHSPMREIEVLYDNLLNMFNDNPNLKLSEIIVMAPDIEIYAPYIEAVFGAADPKLKLPFSIADRNIRRESQLIDTFLKILVMNTGRLNVVEIIDILEVPAILNKFKIYENELESIQRWIKDTEIRWGKDSENRTKLGLPGFEENTWIAGFKRLFLGYSMQGRNEHFFKDILPYDNIEGVDAVLLGKFYQFAETIYETIDTLNESFTLENWSVNLIAILGKFFQPEYVQQSEINKLLIAISELEKYQEISKYKNKVDISIVSYYLNNRLENEVSGHGFLRKGITFCSLLPMRSIPFKIICMIGMNHNTFPRESKPLGFDLMRKEHKPGDRSKRLDDRYLFLESLISARERLYISYVGQSIKDNSAILPSVLVSELIDYAQNYFSLPSKEEELTEEKYETKAFDFLVIKHKLQAFNPEYFSGNSSLFSFSESGCETAKNYIQMRQKYTPPGMIEVSLSELDTNNIDINDLILFFGNPAKYFMQNRLGIYLENNNDIFATSENFSLDSLETAIMGGRIAAKFIEKKSSKGSAFEIESFSNSQYQINKAIGKLPHGNSGIVSFRNLHEDAVSFAKNVLSQLGDRKAGSKEINLKINGIELYGNISSVYENELIQFRYANIKPKDKFRLWISFLALNAGYSNVLNAKLLCRNNKKFYVLKVDSESIAKANAPKLLPYLCRNILSELIDIYKRGLRAPIRFFPKTSLAYYDTIKKHPELIKEKKQELTEDDRKLSIEAIVKAREVWDGSPGKDGCQISGEKEDAYYKLCFRNNNIFDEEFKNESIRVYKYIDAYLKEVK